MADTDLARRMFEAWNHLERRLGKRVTFAELGALVAAEQHGRDEDYSASVMARWIKAEQEPKTREGWRALSAALQVDPGWLVFGTGRMEIAEPVTEADLPPIGHRPGDPAVRPPKPPTAAPAPKKDAKRR